MSFWGELKRRNVFKVAVAYLVASWLIVQIVGVLTEPLNLPDILDTVVVVLLAIGFPFALIVSWIYDVTPEGVQITSSAGGESTSRASGKRLTYAVIVLFVLALGLMAVNRLSIAPLPERFGAGSRLAILPCIDQSPDPSNAFFAPGIHSELIRQLSSLSGLDVIPQNSVQRYADGQTPIPQVAEDLQAQAVMTCVAQYSGNLVRLTTSLNDGSADKTLWSEAYMADMSDLSEIFDIQADIAMKLMNALRVEFLDDEREQIERSPTQSREAYELYLAARALNAATGDGPRMLDLLDDALGIDPNFAEAWSLKSGVQGVIHIAAMEADATRLLAEAMEAAERAISLAPSQGDGYQARAQARAEQHDWLGAGQDFEAAQALGFASTDFSLRFLLSTGYVRRARELLEQALDTDPLSPNGQYSLMIAEEMLGDPEAADAVFRRGERLFASGPWLGRPASTWIRLGRDEVGPEYDPVFPIAGIPELNEWIENPELGLARLRSLAEDPQNQTPVRSADYAILAAYFGAPEFAIELLDRTSGLLMFLTWLPVFDEVRQLPAFKDLLRDMGLVEYWQTHGWPDVCSPLGEEDFTCS